MILLIVLTVFQVYMPYKIKLFELWVGTCWNERIILFIRNKKYTLYYQFKKVQDR